ncbi:lysophospholipid acyltransferase family protein [Micromonospora sp. SH-82]|uniref:lysophospholipid acyltransferase family protein n=1 Tax=Micromonospora sp. SH-82 TaxID=3132938 RepID=UPI003EBB2D7F
MTVLHFSRPARYRPGTDAATVSVPHRIGRGVAVLVLLVAGVGLAAVVPLLTAPAARGAVRRWSRGLLRALGVRLTVTGRLPRRRALLVANHVSWLDVLALQATAPARLVAEREVRSRSLLGLLARAARSVTVDRSRPRNLPTTVGEVTAALRAGDPVGVFPEGTTWCSRGGGADRGASRPVDGFRPAMFQAAIDTGAPVVPLHIGYHLAGGGSDVAALLGDHTLWRSARRVLAARGLVVAVTVTAPLHPAADADRRALARIAETAVRSAPSTHPVPVRSHRVGSQGVFRNPSASPQARPA